MLSFIPPELYRLNMPANPRKQSIVEQPGLTDDFVPLYDIDNIRVAPEVLLRKFSSRLKDSGMILEEKLMNLLLNVFMAKLSAQALLANTEMSASDNNDIIAMTIEQVDANINVIGIPMAKLASWALKQGYAIKTRRKREKQFLLAGSSDDIKTHATIFSYLFVQIVSPHLQSYLPDEARQSLDNLYSKKDLTQTKDIPYTVLEAFYDIVRDVMHIIYKDLAERKTEINYDTMLLSALMGIPASRLSSIGSKVSPLLRDHISSKYQAKRSAPRQLFIETLNKVFKTIGLRPYNESISTVGLITRAARMRIRAIQNDTAHSALWREIDHLMFKNRKNIAELDLGKKHIEFVSEYLAASTINHSNKVTFEKAKLSANLLEQAESGNEHLLPKIDSKDIEALNRIIRNFNIKVAHQQILEQSTQHANKLVINKITRLDDIILEDIFTLFLDSKESFQEIEFIEFSLPNKAVDQTALENFRARAATDISGITITVVDTKPNVIVTAPITDPTPVAVVPYIASQTPNTVDSFVNVEPKITKRTVISLETPIAAYADDSTKPIVITPKSSDSSYITTDNDSSSNGSSAELESKVATPKTISSTPMFALARQELSAPPALSRHVTFAVSAAADAREDKRPANPATRSGSFYVKGDKIISSGKAIDSSLTRKVTKDAEEKQQTALVVFTDPNDACCIFSSGENDINDFVLKAPERKLPNRRVKQQVIS